MFSSPEFVAIAILSALIIGVGKGGLGGIVLIVVPLMSTVVDASTALAITLPLLIVGDVFGLVSYWRKWDAAQIRLLMPAGIIGTIVGTYIVAGIDDTILRRVIGVLTLVYVGYWVISAALARAAYDPPRWVAWVAGVVAGITSSLGAAGSPAFTAYYLLKRPSPQLFMGTFTLFFAVSNAVKLPFFIQTKLLTWEGFISTAWVMPFIPVGVWAGLQFIKRVNKQTFDRVILVLLVFTGVWLLIP